jgi:hypothetical protein
MKEDPSETTYGSASGAGSGAEGHARLNRRINEVRLKREDGSDVYRLVSRSDESKNPEVYIGHWLYWHNDGLEDGQTLEIKLRNSMNQRYSCFTMDRSYVWKARDIYDEGEYDAYLQPDNITVYGAEARDKPKIIVKDTSELQLCIQKLKGALGEREECRSALRLLQKMIRNEIDPDDNHIQMIRMCIGAGDRELLSKLGDCGRYMDEFIDFIRTEIEHGVRTRIKKSGRMGRKIDKED